MAHRRLLPALALIAPLAIPAFAAEDPQLVDRVVAVVDEDPILLSDLERVIALGLAEAKDGESVSSLRRRVLDALIEQRIRLHEIGRFGFEQAPLELVERQLEALRARFPDDDAYRSELRRMGIDEVGVRQLLARQLAVLEYVEERLGPRIFVGLEEIRRYYDDELAPRQRAAGALLPPLEEVRESIRALLREERLDEEIDRWTAELRAQADVVDLLDEPERPLPPEVATFPAAER